MTHPLTARLAGRGLLLDTNLLVFLAAGLARPESIGGKRLEKYSLPQFMVLCQVVAASARLVVTPHVLAETSNLLKMILWGEPLTMALSLLMRDDFPVAFDGGMHALVAVERHVPKTSLDQQFVCRLGVADAGLLCAARDQGVTLMTDDLDLYLGALTQQSTAENFSHVWDD